MNEETNTEPTKPVPVFSNRNQEIVAEILTLEANQSRAVREAALGNPARLKEIDSKIVDLREELNNLNHVVNVDQSVS